jgi:Mitochondrial carrier protein
MAGIITCPLDVVKTRIQTQHNPDRQGSAPHPSSKTPPAGAKPPKMHATQATATTATSHELKRPISTSSPSTSLRPRSAALLDTSSVMTGLKIIYKTEGIRGLFRGVGPRAVWTSVQSGTMLVMYQALLRYFEKHPLVNPELGASIYGR